MRRHCDPRFRKLPGSRDGFGKHRGYTNYTCRGKVRSNQLGTSSVAVSFRSLPGDRTKAIQRGDIRTTFTENCLGNMLRSCRWAGVGG